MTTKPLTRAQKLAGALEACKELKTRAKRAACKRQARARYARTAKKKGRSSKRSRRAGK